MLLGMLAFPTYALANVHHAYRGILAELSAEEASGLVVDPGEGVGSGHLWVALHDAGVAEFNDVTGAKQAEIPASPTFGSPEGVAVGHGAGETQVYVTYTSGEVGVFDTSGALLGQWTGPGTERFGSARGIAADTNTNTLVDPGAGRVYVYDETHHVVDVFQPLPHGREELVTTIHGPSSAEPFRLSDHLAVDAANGDLIVEDLSNDQQRVAVVFKPTAVAGYEETRELTAPPSGEWGTIPLAVDPGEGASADEGDVYAIETKIGTSVVDELNVATGSFAGRITGAETPGGNFGSVAGALERARPESIAVDPSSHEVYLGVTNHAFGAHDTIMAFGSGVVLPDVSYKGEPAPVLVGASGGNVSESLSGAVNPRETETHTPATCEFAFGTSASELTSVAPCNESTLSGSSPLQVSAALSLHPDTAYFYRLEASNPGGTNPGEEEENGELAAEQEFTSAGPGLHGESASEVSATAATLSATVNPHKAPTSYYFEYGRETCSTSAGTCQSSGSGEPLGAGESDVSASVHVQELEPDTLYHYRAVVVSDEQFGGAPAKEVVYDEPEHTFRTRSASATAGMLDGRQWELVSPPNKHGALVIPLNGDQAESQVAAGGGAITYVTGSPVDAHPAGYSILEQELSVRGADRAWTSCGLATARSGSEGVGRNYPEYPLFSEDLSRALVEQEGFDTGLLSEEASERTPYLRTTMPCAAVRAFQPLVTAKEPFADVPSDTPAFGGEGLGPSVRLRAASRDLKHIIIFSSVPLLSGVTGPGVYEWSAEGPSAQRLELLSTSINTVGSTSVSFPFANGRNVVSDDGTRVFWPGFMHDSVTHETIATGGFSSIFQFATPTIRGPSRRSVAVFTEERNLYQCEVVEIAEKSTCIRTRLGPAGASVQRDILGASEDASYVYAVGNGVIGDGAEKGATPGGCGETKQNPFTTTCNLYVFHNGEVKFIAKLSGDDEMDWGNKQGGFGNELGGLWAAVSPNGRYAAFLSDRPLTGYDNRDVNTGLRDEEVYLYDAATERLVCASCDPTGARPTGVVDNESATQLVFPRPGLEAYGGTSFAASLPGYTQVGGFGTALTAPRYLTNDGRLFFNADSALVPSDTNGTEDVYEYEPQGTGSCTGPETSGTSAVFEPARSFEVEGRTGEEPAGCVGLISSGSSDRESALMGASEDGSDVFFITSSRLVESDVDGAYDVYDAHACSSASPCPGPQSTPAPECESADRCRSAPTPQPETFGAPASATFSGAGNAAPAEPPTPPVNARPLTRRQRVQRALAACRRHKNKAKRRMCERQARRHAGLLTSTVTKAKTGGARR